MQCNVIQPTLHTSELMMVNILTSGQYKHVYGQSLIKFHMLSCKHSLLNTLGWI
jgi:hypothetical protein